MGLQQASVGGSTACTQVHISEEGPCRRSAAGCPADMRTQLASWEGKEGSGHHCLRQGSAVQTGMASTRQQQRCVTLGHRIGGGFQSAGPVRHMCVFAGFIGRTMPQS